LLPNNTGMAEDITPSPAETGQRVVVIAVDRSQQAEKAFDYYVKSLHRENNVVRLVHVPEGVTTAMSKGMHLPEGEWQKMKKREEEEMAEMRQIYDKKMKEANLTDASLHVAYGKPGEAIVKAANDFEASMIVMGTRGMGTIRRTILGSVSDYIIHHAKSPVVVCRAEHKK